MLRAPNMAGMARDATGMEIDALHGQVATGGVGRAVSLTILGFACLKMG